MVVISPPVHTHPTHTLVFEQAINLAENAFTSADDLVTLAKIPTLRYLNIKSNDMRAIEVQRVRDAFEDRTGFVLES